MHSKAKRTACTRLREEGHTLKEISKKLNIAKSTASLWCQGIKVNKKGKQRLQTRAATKTKPTGGAHYLERRNEAFQRGQDSDPTPLDAMCVGLYWGDGSKWKGLWKFTNSEFRTVEQMARWAIRAGQSPGKFRAVIVVHDEDGHTDKNLRDHWAKVGIPRQRISITRVRKHTKKKHRGKLPYGTCQFSSVKNGAWLFSYYEGQRETLTAR